LWVQRRESSIMPESSSMTGRVTLLKARRAWGEPLTVDQIGVYRD
jgi:hypothetical protein